MVEFTGERVVPGQVNDDLWSEHLARYAFAQRYAAGKRVLDCGCGTGYGAAELARDARHVTGIDIAAEAIDYARLNYARPNTRYITASAADLPFADASFDLITAFELIEHLCDFRRLLAECRRVLAPGGLLIASTPNKRYYAESRAEAGPNPYHQHEFEAEEFRSELLRVFPEVSVIVQNHVESVVFHGAGATAASAARVDGNPGLLEEAHFFIALCSLNPLPPFQSFIYVPNAANLLREREHHIKLLQDQLRRTQNWLSETQRDRDALLMEHRKELEAHAEQTRWAQQLEQQLTAAQTRIVDLQQEFAEQQQTATEAINAYSKQVRELESENDAKTRWALETDERLRAEIDRLGKELQKAVQALQEYDEALTDRTKWAQRLAEEKEALKVRKEALEAQLNAVRASRWVRAGRMFGIGPVLQ